MSFLKGSVSYLRFRVNGAAVASFGQDHLDRLADRQAGRQRIASADGIEVGWTASDHILDTDFTLEKNVVNDALHFDLRIDSDKLPADLLRAYYAVELKALTANNPSGFPSVRQKREAKESARERLEEEGKDGRFRKRKCVPIMWDRSGYVYFGATSISQVDRLCGLFEQTFQKELECITSGLLPPLVCEEHIDAIMDNAAPSAFIPGTTPADVAWIASSESADYLGNEFLLWLWYYTELESDTLKVADGSEITVMLAKTLTLDCPRGLTGYEVFTHEGPTRLPEARRAIQSGKLPRKVGLTMVRQDQQYELKLAAETFAVGSAKLPAVPEDTTDVRARLEWRVDAVRELDATLGLLYGAFLERRLSAKWADELTGMQKWLKREEARRAA